MRLWWWLVGGLVGCAPGVARVGAPAPAPVSGPAASASPGEPVPTGPEDYQMVGFSFVDAHTAGLPQPGGRAPLEQDLSFLVDQGIGLLVSLTETPTDPDAVAAAGLDLLHLPIPDMEAPTFAQQQTFVLEVQDRVDRGELTGVHCWAGLGRTGTMLATWMVAGGLPADEAIAAVRLARPGSIETMEQEAAVFRFAERWR